MRAGTSLCLLTGSPPCPYTPLSGADTACRTRFLFSVALGSFPVAQGGRGGLNAKLA